MARILLALVLLLGAAACGDDDTEGTTDIGLDDPPTDEPALDATDSADEDLISAIESYARTRIEGDPEALAEERSERCGAAETDITPLTTAVAGEAGEIGVGDIDAEVDGDEATVTYRLDPGAQVIGGERWIREDGEWRWDDC